MENNLLRMTTDIVIAYINKNDMAREDIPKFITTVYLALQKSSNEPSIEGQANMPAIAIKNSITPDYIICLEDGRKLKMLKRHLWTTYQMTPQDYRSKWKLPEDYPMVAPNYAKKRSDFAKRIGLGKNSSLGN